MADTPILFPRDRTEMDDEIKRIRACLFLIGSMAEVTHDVAGAFWRMAIKAKDEGEKAYAIGMAQPHLTALRELREALVKTADCIGDHQNDGDSGEHVTHLSDAAQVLMDYVHGRAAKAKPTTQK